MQYGIFPQLAALETIVYPPSTTLQNNFNLAQAGTLEIMPDPGAADAVRVEREPHRAGPPHRFQHHRGGVRPALNPIRAKVSLGMRVLSIDDLGFNDKGGSLYMVYQQQKEALARLYQGGTLRRPGHPGHSMSNDPPRPIPSRRCSRRPRCRTLCSPPPAATTASTRSRCTAADGTTIVYLRRRFVPSPDRFQLLQEHASSHGERLDNIAAKYLGDPKLFWRIATPTAPCGPRSSDRDRRPQAAHHAARRHYRESSL